MKTIAVHLMVERNIKIESGKLARYAQEIRERFDLKPDASVYMDEVVRQMMIDGDLEKLGAWYCEYNDELTPDLIEQLGR